MRVHPNTTSLPTTTALGRNPTPSTSTTTLCSEKNMGAKTREMVDKLVPLQHTMMSKASCSPLGATNRDRNPRNREHHGRPLFLTTCPFQPNNLASTTKPCNLLQSWWCRCRHDAPLPFQHPIGDDVIVSRLHPHIFYFYARKPPPTVGFVVEHQLQHQP